MLIDPFTLYPAAGPPPGAVLHQSTFTAPNGTALQDYTPEIGNAFIIRIGSFEIQGNQLGSLETESEARSELGHSGDLEAVWTLEGTSSGNAWAYVLLTKFNLGGNLYWRTEVDMVSNDRVVLKEGGTQRGTIPNVVTPGAEEIITVEHIGNDVTVKTKSGDIAYTSSSHQTNTGVGFYSWLGANQFKHRELLVNDLT